MAPGDGEDEVDKDLAARKKFDSIDDLDTLTPDEVARRTALNVHWLRKDQEIIRDQINKLVPEKVCEARSRAITAEIKGVGGNLEGQIASEVTKQVPQAIKSAMTEVTGVRKLTELLEEVADQKTAKHKSGLSWVRNNFKLFVAIVTFIIGLATTGIVKTAYFVVDMDTARQIREAETAKMLKRVEKKIEPKYRYIRMAVPVVPDASVRHEQDRKRRRR
jgi:hypothetical protein